MITRRQFSLGTGLGLLGASGMLRAAGAAQDWAGGLEQAFAGIERQVGGRLGVAVLDTGTGRRAGHRQAERFPLCSTFKVLAASAILAQVDRGETQLTKRVVFSAADVVANSPLTKGRVGGNGMALSEICEAAITASDNTAGNMMLRQIGGPAGLTRYLRSIGDRDTRLDRTETSLNEAVPGDPRDTTLPSAMLADLDHLVLGSLLSPASRDQLATWMKRTKTGDARLRAHLPQGWVVGDKTGTGDNGTANDVGVIWRPGAAPLIVCVYLTGTKASAERCSAVIADVGHAVARSLAAG